MIKCENCGDAGHFASQCPWQGELGTMTRPPWCGECDKVTRLIDHGSYLQRCHRCHPRAHSRFPQHRVCGGCGQLVYAWDVLPCDKHQALGIDARGHRAA